MRILVDIGHPAHVHFFKFVIRKLEENGHDVMITVRPKDVVLELLDHYGFEYSLLTEDAQTPLGLLQEYLLREWKLGQVIREYKPDVITAIGGSFIAPIGKACRVPTVVFTDTEHVKLDRLLTFPFASVVYTPEWFQVKAGPNQKRYNGLHETAYLHPKYFRPNPAVLQALNLKEYDRFVIIRIISWKAGHDLGQYGFTLQQTIQLIDALSENTKVILNVEGRVPEELAGYLVRFNPEDIHDLLYYASLYIGEGATMASEAGLLGTPAILVNSLIGKQGYYHEHTRIGLVQTFRDGDQGVKRALEILQDPSVAKNQQEISKKIFQEMGDVVEFVTDAILSCGKK